MTKVVFLFSPQDLYSQTRAFKLRTQNKLIIELFKTEILLHQEGAREEELACLGSSVIEIELFVKRY